MEELVHHPGPQNAPQNIMTLAPDLVDLLVEQ